MQKQIKRSRWSWRWSNLEVRGQLSADPLWRSEALTCVSSIRGGSELRGVTTGFTDRRSGMWKPGPRSFGVDEDGERPRHREVVACRSAVMLITDKQQSFEPVHCTHHVTFASCTYHGSFGHSELRCVATCFQPFAMSSSSYSACRSAASTKFPCPQKLQHVRTTIPSTSSVIRKAFYDSCFATFLAFLG